MDNNIRGEIISRIREVENRPTYEVLTTISKPLISLWLISNDIESILNSIKKAIQFSKIETIQVDDIIISALWQKAVMTYGKMFMKSKDGYSSLETSKYIIGKLDLFIHERIMSVRHSFIAHRGINDFENCIMTASLNIKKEGCYFEYSIPSLIRVGNYFDNEETEEIISFLNRLKKKVDEKFYEKLKKVDKMLWDILQTKNERSDKNFNIIK